MLLISWWGEEHAFQRVLIKSLRLLSHGPHGSLFHLPLSFPSNSFAMEEVALAFMIGTVDFSRANWDLLYKIKNIYTY